MNDWNPRWQGQMAGMKFKFREHMHDELHARGIRYTGDTKLIGDAVVDAMLRATLAYVCGG